MCDCLTQPPDCCNCINTGEFVCDFVLAGPMLSHPQRKLSLPIVVVVLLSRLWPTSMDDED